MALYQLEVVETQEVRVVYLVDAPTPEEAIRLAEIGDTVAETKLRCQSAVREREVVGGPTEVHYQP